MSALSTIHMAVAVMICTNNPFNERVSEESKYTAASIAKQQNRGLRRIGIYVVDAEISMRIKVNSLLDREPGHESYEIFKVQT